MASTLLCACSSSHSSESKPMLAVSIEPQRKLLEAIVGDNYAVASMLPTGANPETFEPTVSQRMQIDKAAAYFTIGFLPFEKTLAASLQGKAPVSDVSQGIHLLTGTHVHGDHVHEGVADPHTWTSARNAKTMAANMLQSIIQLDPENAETYTRNYANLIAQIDSLDNQIAEIISTAPSRSFAVWHPSLSYFARDYGLHQIAVGQESKEISISTLRSIVDEAKADSARVFFFQKEYDSRQAESINKEMGTRIVTINPLDYDWDKQLIEIAYELAK